MGVRPLDYLAGARARRLRLGFADLAGLLGGLGVSYDSAIGRAVASAVAALTRGAAEAESGRIAERLGALEPAALLWPAPPAETPVPGLAEAARAALDAARTTLDEAQRDREWLEHAVAELSALAAEPGEEETLSDARATMQSGAKISDELANRRFRAPEYSECQIRRIIYG